MIVSAAVGIGCAKKHPPELQVEVEKLRREIEAMQAELRRSSERLETLQGQITAASATTASERPVEDTEEKIVSSDVAPSVGGSGQGSHTSAASGDKRDAAGSAKSAGKATPPQSRSTSNDRGGDPAEQERYYNEAFILYGQKQYPQAIARFQEFAGKFPGSSLADNAYYWIGESYLDMNQPQAALDAFQRLIQKYPSANKVPDALIKSGVALVRLNELGKAADAFRAVVERYPDTEAAASAREHLARMEGK